MENENKRLAWFPAPFLELWDGEEDDASEYQLGGATLMRFLFCFVFVYKNRTHLPRSIGRYFITRNLQELVSQVT